VGKYTVIMEEFEPLALRCLSGAAAHACLIIDEIGKMENFRNGVSGTFYDFSHCISSVAVFLDWNLNNIIPSSLTK
jgi:nucleoside-triphosphatase THEP1